MNVPQFFQLHREIRRNSIGTTIKGPRRNDLDGWENTDASNISWNVFFSTFIHEHVIICFSFGRHDSLAGGGDETMVYNYSDKDERILAALHFLLRWSSGWLKRSRSVLFDRAAERIVVDKDKVEQHTTQYLLWSLGGGQTRRIHCHCSLAE